MVASLLDGVRLAGVCTCLPAAKEDSEALVARFGAAAIERIVKATGITRRHVTAPTQCTSDLAEAAARHLLERLGWNADSIDLLVFVSQTHDHLLPATACLVHQRLGLGKHCAVFDQGLGCSGYVYGLWTAAALLRSLTPGRRALLLCGDTTARLCARGDRTVAPLFGDAAAATALQRDEQILEPWAFDLGSDGSGAPYLMVHGGAMRVPGEPPELFMDGTQVFAFTLREVPDSIRRTLARLGWSVRDVDHIVLHQANEQMIRHLGQKLQAVPAQMVVSLADYGNTSSASIPLAMTTGLAGRLDRWGGAVLLSGFGVGWSWATVALRCPPLPCLDTLTLDEAGQLGSVSASSAAADGLPVHVGNDP